MTSFTFAFFLAKESLKSCPQGVKDALMRMPPFGRGKREAIFRLQYLSTIGDVDFRKSTYNYEFGKEFLC